MTDVRTNRAPAMDSNEAGDPGLHAPQGATVGAMWQIVEDIRFGEDGFPISDTTSLVTTLQELCKETRRKVFTGPVDEAVPPNDPPTLVVTPWITRAAARMPTVAAQEDYMKRWYDQILNRPGKGLVAYLLAATSDVVGLDQREWTYAQDIARMGVEFHLNELVTREADEFCDLLYAQWIMLCEELIPPHTDDHRLPLLQRYHTTTAWATGTDEPEKLTAVHAHYVKWYTWLNELAVLMLESITELRNDAELLVGAALPYGLRATVARVGATLAQLRAGVDDAAQFSLDGGDARE